MLFYVILLCERAKAEWRNPNPDEGPALHYKIPDEIHEAGKQFDRVDLARRIAAARQARKEEDRAIGHQLRKQFLLLKIIFFFKLIII